MIKKFLLRWIINVCGLGAASALLSGVDYGAHTGVLIWAALIFSMVNALIRPLVVVLALPAIILSLGLFMLVVNGFMLYLVTVFYHQFRVASLTQAILAVTIVWVVNYIFTSLIEGVRNESAV